MLVASKKVRAVVKAMFTDAFASLPLGRDDELRILDVGCGLGFLSCVSAEFYKDARITGIDTFKHASLKRSSIDRAKENTRILGFSDRIDFKGSHLPKSSTSSSLTLCFITLERCDSRPTPAFHHGHSPALLS
jgi:cyclopropane fatty-acyl-phospholipid synthase-like methyltransferase